MCYNQIHVVRNEILVTRYNKGIDQLVNFNILISIIEFSESVLVKHATNMNVKTCCII